MVKKNFHACDKVDYLDNAILTNSSFHRDVEILPSCHQVEFVDLSLDGSTGTTTVRAIVDIESGVADVYTLGSAGAVTVAREINKYLLAEDNTFEVAATDITFGANSISVKANREIPASLVGAPVRLIFDDTDANAKLLPEMLFVSAVSSDTATIQLDKITALSAASTGAVGMQILGDAYTKRNIPAIYSSATKSGAEAVLKGSFPFRVAENSTVAIRSNSKIVKKQYRGKQESLRFPILSSDASTGTIRILDENNYLQAWTTDGTLEYAEIDKVAGFGTEYAGETTFQQAPGRTLVSLTGFATTSLVKMIQHLRG